MKLDVQRRIAASVLKCSPNRVVFDSTKLKEIKEAITKADIRGLVIDGFLWKRRKSGISGYHSRRIKLQKTKGRQRGHGSRKGKKTARTPRKELWIHRVRLQRKMLKLLKNKKAIDNAAYWELYKKIKGGFFRSKRHLQLYIGERKLGTAAMAGPEKEAKEEKKKAKGKKETKK